MQVYVIRHGETEWNKEEVFRGRKDIPLNEAGRRQAEKVGLYFYGRHLNRIVASPLTRAVQTAGPISETAGVPVEAMEEFTDMNFGVWEGVSLREVEDRYPSDLTLWRESPERLRIERGENLATVRERISRGFAKLFSDEDAAIAVVTHRVVCKMAVLYLLGIEDRHFWDMKFDPGSITLLDGKNGRFTLVFSNETCHLREGLPTTQYRDF